MKTNKITKKTKKNSIIVLTGPTASGKTTISVEIAKELDTEIISVDSRQIYKLMDICTAKPTKSELESVKHHLIDVLYPNDDYSAGKFVDDSETIIKKLQSEYKTPILCGGTGFYIKALFEGLFTEKQPINSMKYRELLNLKFEKEGIEALQKELKLVDINSYNSIELHNPHRVIRALEYFYCTNESIVKAHKRHRKLTRFNPIYFAIDFPREILYNRINIRCEQMWNNGLVKEYQNLLSLGYSKDLNSLNTVGYKEVDMYLNNLLTQSEALEEFKKNTRRYAKRQLTWFRKNEKIVWIDYSISNKVQFIIDNLNSK